MHPHARTRTRTHTGERKRLVDKLVRDFPDVFAFPRRHTTRQPDEHSWYALTGPELAEHRQELAALRLMQVGGEGRTSAHQGAVRGRGGAGGTEAHAGGGCFGGGVLAGAAGGWVGAGGGAGGHGRGRDARAMAMGRGCKGRRGVRAAVQGMGGRAALGRPHSLRTHGVPPRPCAQEQAEREALDANALTQAMKHKRASVAGGALGLSSQPSRLSR